MTPLFIFIWAENLQGVRLSSWKLHVPHNYLGVGKPGSGGDIGAYEVEKIGLSLYNLEKDPGEKNNVAEQHPEIVRRLVKLIGDGRAELGDSGADVPGSSRGVPGRVNEYWQELDSDIE